MDSSVAMWLLVALVGLSMFIALAVVVLVLRTTRPSHGQGHHVSADSGQQLRGRFERYEIRGRIGVGGMADIYRAIDQVDNTVAALKVIKANLLEDPQMVERFKSEAAVLKALNQVLPNGEVVTFLRQGRESSTRREFIALELVEGEALSAMLNKGYRPTLMDTAKILTPVAVVIDAAHADGIWHRDLSPDNIMVHRVRGSVERVTLIDFGVARHEYTSHHTLDGSSFGKPAYMSPEQARGESGTLRADLYSFGIIAYQMLSGSVPFVSATNNPLEVLNLHKSAPVPSLPAQYSEPLRAIIQQCLAKQPEERPVNAMAVIQVLRAAAGLPTWQPTTASPPPAAEPVPTPAAAPPAPAAPVAPPPEGPQALSAAIEATEPAAVPEAPAKPPAQAPRPRRAPAAMTRALLLASVVLLVLAGVPLLLASQSGTPASTAPAQFPYQPRAARDYSPSPGSSVAASSPSRPREPKPALMESAPPAARPSAAPPPVAPNPTPMAAAQPVAERVMSDIKQLHFRLGQEWSNLKQDETEFDRQVHKFAVWKEELKHLPASDSSTSAQIENAQNEATGAFIYWTLKRKLEVEGKQAAREYRDGVLNQLKGTSYQAKYEANIKGQLYVPPPKPKPKPPRRTGGTGSGGSHLTPPPRPTPPRIGGGGVRFD